jgi:thiol-disulfide isomerase/thioredoxin
MLHHLSKALLWLLALSACSPTPESTPPTPLQEGTWRAVIELQEQELPFTFELQSVAEDAYQIYIINGEERLLLDEVLRSGDSLDIPMNFFDTRIRAAISDGQLQGEFIKNYAEDYRLPFRAEYGENYRFLPVAATEAADFSGKWEVLFKGDSLPSVGIFEQQGNTLTGSFLTTTGDYRFLAGNVKGDTMLLSAFDGEHAFLFEARLRPDGSLQGDFWSGKSYHNTWTASRNAEAALPDPNELTYLKKDYDQLSFTFPNLQGEPVSLSDERYRGKVVIVQLFGTWCPNCMDETRFYADWYRRNKDRGVEIIGLAYERKDDFDYASRRVSKMIEKLDVGYDFLIAGIADKEAAGRTLPMLNRVMSFPTSIFIDRNGQVRNIHTGFSGPGTGIYYQQFVEEFNILMDKLLAEEASF